MSNAEYGVLFPPCTTHGDCRMVLEVPIPEATRMLISQPLVYQIVAQVLGLTKLG